MCKVDAKLWITANELNLIYEFWKRSWYRFSVVVTWLSCLHSVHNIYVETFKIAINHKSNPKVFSRFIFQWLGWRKVPCESGTRVCLFEFQVARRHCLYVLSISQLSPALVEGLSRLETEMQLYSGVFENVSSHSLSSLNHMRWWHRRNGLSHQIKLRLSFDAQ